MFGFIATIVSNAVATVSALTTKVAATVIATGETAVNPIDENLVDSLINLAKACMGLFTEFPINIILIGGLAGVAFGLIRKAKKTAR